MEGAPERREISVDVRELLRTPEQVFDSDLKKAREESRQVAERLKRMGERRREGRGVEINIAGRGLAKTIQIAWAEWRDQKAMMLSLDPITEGMGVESGVFGYRGRYGIASRIEGEFKYDGNDSLKVASLEDLFMVPRDISLIVMPTVERWAVGVDELSMAYRNARTLYMGLGFLLSGREAHKWMLVGMHEAGHLPDEGDENVAWTKANRNYARLTRGNKARIKAIVEGKFHGRFGLLEKPGRRSRDITIGKIVQYGLVSHALAGNAWVSERWMDKSRRIMDEFSERIVEAREAFDGLVY